MVLIHVDFKLTGRPCKPTHKGLKTCGWRHRLLKKYMFLQPQNANGKTWNTGVWNKRLAALAKGSSDEKNLVVISCAKF